MIDLKQFISAIDQIAEEKGITRERVQDIIEQALAAAYKRDYGEKGQNITAQLNPETGEARFFQAFEVVSEDQILSEEEIEELERKRKEEREKEESADQEQEEPDTGEEDEDRDEEDTEEKEIENKEEEKEEGEDDEDKEEDEDNEEERKFRFNEARHVMLEDAKEKKEDTEPGDEILEPLETKDDFGRIAAQTAKQVIIQRIREAERDAIYEEFKEKQGEIVSGTVQRIERGVVYLDIGKTTGVIFPEEQIPGERYRQGQRVRVYVVRVERESRGPTIVLSRKHPRIISQLFELEVPEIASGSVEIKSVAREAGSRTKIAVTSHEEGIDPVGACVGQKGIRVSAVINELSGENIDIIEWDEDPATFIGNALSPAKVLNVEVDEDEHTAVVDVHEDQLSLAIGRKGQNVRLAAKLTGWKIDVRGADAALEDKEDEEAIEASASPEEGPVEDGTPNTDTENADQEQEEPDTDEEDESKDEEDTGEEDRDNEEGEGAAPNKEGNKEEPGDDEEEKQEDEEDDEK